MALKILFMLFFILGKSKLAAVTQELMQLKVCSDSSNCKLSTFSIE